MEITVKSVLLSIATTIVAVVLLKLVKSILIKKVAYRTKDDVRANAFDGILFNILQYVIILVAIMLILKINGFNITGLLAGLGIIATVVGLSLQDTLKDIFAGINIYANSFYKVGDIVMYEGNKCEVKYFSARITKFRNLYTNSTFTVCNSCINSIEKVKGTQILTMCFDVSDSKKKIDKCFENVCIKLDIDIDIKNPHYLGIVKIDDNGATYGIMYDADPADFEAEMRMYQYIYEELSKIKLSPNTRDGIKIKQDPWDK